VDARLLGLFGCRLLLGSGRVGVGPLGGRALDASLVGYDNGVYLWHAGYWVRTSASMAGINYGFGYTGRGYYGGYWNHGRLFYNRAVTNVNSATFRDVITTRCTAAAAG